MRAAGEAPGSLVMVPKMPGEEGLKPAPWCVSQRLARKGRKKRT